MSIKALEFIASQMNSYDVPYSLMEWKGKVPEMYFVGEYQETDSSTKEENGFQETAFILTGFTRKSYLLLEEVKEKIEKNMPKTAILDDGSGIAVFYNSAFTVPTGDAELKRIQINLVVKEWRVI